MKYLALILLLVSSQAAALEFGQWRVYTVSVRNNGDIAMQVCRVTDQACQRTGQGRSTLIIENDAPAKVDQYALTMIAVALDLPVIIATMTPALIGESNIVHQVGIKP